jgi:phage FluMu protein Com
VTRSAVGYTTLVSGVGQQRSVEVDCPHCHKAFDAEPLASGRAARYRGFKCPHCKLFVPLQRAAAAIDPRAS